MENIVEKSTEASLILHLFDIANKLKRNGDALAAREGITTQQWLVLLHLQGDPNLPIWKNELPHPVTASELADSLGVSRAYITNLLTILVEKKIIEQTIDTIDRRKKNLKLTILGKQILANLEPPRVGANELLFSVFSKEQRQFFLSFIKNCSQELDNLKK